MSWLKERILNWFQSVALRVIKTGEVPKHVALIMDGNRRYANKHNLRKKEGHSKGLETLIEILKACMDLGIVEITIYAFSIENFKRSKEEVDDLMDLARKMFNRLLDEKKKLKDIGVCIRVIGNFSLIPEDLRKIIAKTMIFTRENNRMFLNIAAAYTLACSTVTVKKCQAALRTLQAFTFFRPTCLCREPHVDPDCNSFQNFLFDHPCDYVEWKDKDPYPIDALPTCNHALNTCLRGKPCNQIFKDFKTNCKTQEGQCKMENRDITPLQDCRRELKEKMEKTIRSLIAFGGSISRIENLSIGEECNESNIEAPTPADVENPSSCVSFFDMTMTCVEGEGCLTLQEREREVEGTIVV
ncbi:Dehydrodolichyl diphosphate synthase [Trachymyrmex cornetzi]|uniref:Alkyl transferase n=1 Tax=Trachymyrmex cornetzi TaxID=471704 RepID=A0A195E5Y8_9HYME|nr:Dehydrodolichyl diphosphate synthase [Trachymyrmex cornetzi]